MEKGVIDPMQRKGTVIVFSNGCPDNRMDSALAEKFLAENGWQIVADWKDANLILFNACGLSQSSEDYSLNIIRDIESKKEKDQRLIVWGCLPKINPIAVEKAFKGKVLPGSEPDKLIEMLDLKTAKEIHTNVLGKAMAPTENLAPHYRRYSGSRVSRLVKIPAQKGYDYIGLKFNLLDDKNRPVFYIKVSSGCTHRCAFCAIKNSRGNITSKPINNIIEEFHEGLSQGFKVFSLMGTDLGSYGSDLGYNLIYLLDSLLKIPGDFKLNLRNVHPSFIIKNLPEFTNLLDSGKIRYIETAAESGSNRLLSLMNRGYTIEQYKQCVKTLHKICPKLLIRTQLMVGFPSETDEDFNQTIKLLSDLVFDYVEVYEYSERPNTPSVKIEPKVPIKVKETRHSTLLRKAMTNRTGRKIIKIMTKQT